VSRPPTGQELQQIVRQRVGGFLSNAFYVPNQTCAVCYGPSSGRPLCSMCQWHADNYGVRLADHIFVLTYAQGYHPQRLHQSVHMMTQYKAPRPSALAQENVALLMLIATYLHGPCMQQAARSDWQTLTFVPSVRHPGISHPVVDVARHVVGMPESARMVLELGPGASDENRIVRDDRFVVPPTDQGKVAGRHVLVIDDTWTSGAKLQSAAVTLKNAGAAKVTGICVARWCRHDWPEHAQLLNSLDTPYDALTCPASTGACDRALGM
jgi:hypothetical protein